MQRTARVMAATTEEFPCASAVQSCPVKLLHAESTAAYSKEAAPPQKWGAAWVMGGQVLVTASIGGLKLVLLILS